MRAGSRRLLALIFAALGGFFTVVFVLSSWVWTQALDTNTYVATSAVAIDQPQIQAEIANNIVESVVGDNPIDENLRTALEEGARLLVASDGFGSFWQIAHRSMHEVLRDQFLNTDITPQNAQIDITPEVDAVLANLRALDPVFAKILPTAAPSTVIEIADAETINDISSAVRGLDRAQTLSPLFAAVLFALSALMLGVRRKSLVAPALALIATAVIVSFLDSAVAAIARRFVDAEFRDTASTILTHMTQSLSVRSWQLVALAFLCMVVAYFPVRVFTRTGNDEK